MELIKKESTRIHTFQKRKKSLLKKVSEFSILCGVEACLIIFGPKQKNLEKEKLEAHWPSNSDEVKHIINRYKKTKRARCYHISDYFLDKKKKVDIEISKLLKQIYQAKYPSWSIHLDSFVEDQLRILLAQLDKKLEVAYRKLYTFQENPNLMDKLSLRMLYSPHNSFENYATGSNLEPFSNLKPLAVEYPISFQPGQSSVMIPEKNNNLQLFSEYHKAMMTGHLTGKNDTDNNLGNLQMKLFNQELMEDRMRNMSNDQNVSNQFGGSLISNIPSSSGLPYVNPSCWMWDNEMSNNFDASGRNFGSTLQTVLPQLQPHISGLHNNQIFPCDQEDKFYCNIGFEKQLEQKWR
ncbi:hypothetical protein JCGZ_10115 [Jatropha curcas]|uniref:MADS-box domain-containing protein n=1 Tax=Jatropha curcas TaxID=180498 RepID=A0A067LN79_JATCU|nr:hypothetical protein JCGZ_10115 [Jatropha curcas]